MTEVVTLGAGDLVVAPLGEDVADFRAMIAALYDGSTAYPFGPTRTPWTRYGHAVAVRVLAGERADVAEVDVDVPWTAYSLMETWPYSSTPPPLASVDRLSVMLAWFPDDAAVDGYVFRRVVLVPRLVA